MTMRITVSMSALIFASFAAASPAWAGIPPPATPGPLIGAGIPALIGLGYLYKRIRKTRGE